MTVFVLPGMGATSEMYPQPWAKLPKSVFLNWPPYKGESTLTEMASRLIGLEEISSRDVIIGSSLGGMVALEIARLIDCDNVLLIGSAQRASEVNVFLRLAAPLAPLTPIGLSQILGGVSSGNIGRMFKEADADFVVAMSQAVAKWDGVEIDRDRVTRIHGSKDRVIPCPEDADAVIQGAGHLVAYTHPHECVAEVEEIMRRPMPPPAQQF